MRVEFKVYLFSFIIFFLLFLITACKDKPTKPQDPSRQDVVITLNYSGTAICPPWIEHTIHIRFDDENGNAITLREISTNPDELSDGETAHRNLDPGIYNIYVDWDWNDDGGKNGFEPIGYPYPKIVHVDGYQTVYTNIEIIDRTSPNDFGWIEGSLSYSGSETGWHRVYYALQDYNYNTIVEDIAHVSGFGIHIPPYQDFVQLNNNTKGSYRTGYIPPGMYYRLLLSWDINDNGKYDSEPRDDSAREYGAVIFVSPGLPTAGVNMIIK